MLSKKENIQEEIIMYTMEQLVPEDSLYRKIDKYIDFSFIYDIYTARIMDDQV